MLANVRDALSTVPPVSAACSSGYMVDAPAADPMVHITPLRGSTLAAQPAATSGCRPIFPHGEAQPMIRKTCTARRSGSTAIQSFRRPDGAARRYLPATNAGRLQLGPSDRGARLFPSGKLPRTAAGAGRERVIAFTGQTPRGGGPGAAAALCGYVRGVWLTLNSYQPARAVRQGFTVRACAPLTWRPSMPSTAWHGACGPQACLNLRADRKSLYVLAEDRHR